jgi:hypothetical protein
MDPLHSTIEEFVANGYTTFNAFARDAALPFNEAHVLAIRRRLPDTARFFGSAAAVGMVLRQKHGRLGQRVSRV